MGGRYAEAIKELQPSNSDRAAVSSREFALTAYAQLVALRLNAKRALISLFDKEREYIIAEATRTLSLQQDDIHAQTDAMYFGTSVLDRQDDFNRQTLKAHRVEAEPETPPRRYFEVKNLLQDARFANHRFVANEPYARAYVGVPLISPTGYPIGTLSLLDDHPRDASVSDAEVVFMQDIAKTIVSHLEMARVAITHARGLRMVKGLSRFVEGKEDLDENYGIVYRDMVDMEDRQATQTAGLHASRRTHALNAASNHERMDDARRERPGFARTASIMSEGNEDLTFRRKRGPKEDSQEIESPNDPSAMVVPSGAQTVRAESHARGPTTSNRSTTLPSHAPASDRQDHLSKDVRHSFERAAVIINQALSTSGILFLDATVSEFGRLRSGDNSSSSPESDSSVKSDGTSGVASANETSSKPMMRQSNGSRRESHYSNGNGWAELHPCRTLASAYDLAVSTDGKAGILHRPIPERYLKSLLRRFPFGKIWTFDDSGNTSSDEFSDSSAATDPTGSEKNDKTRTPEALRKRSKSRGDGARLANLFPGVRSLAVMPMYDALRERFFAGAVVWSYVPMRLLTVQEDLNYLGAFCDVIMAEVARLDANAEIQAKTSFISSISHELKSPLHGILGGVECLQDSENASIQGEMLQMIDSSGKALLDVINHLLEHAHATSSDRQSTKSNKVARKRSTSSIHYGVSTGHQPLSNLATVTEEVLDTALWVTPKPTPLSTIGERQGIGRANSALPIKVILEIDSSNLGDSGWWCRINAGAWRRIVQNLVANSIKYTDAGGYLKISLSVRPQLPHPDNGADHAPMMAELVCLDSGRGMTQQYLKYGLWQAFSQEDAHAQGSGLGLSLVHGIVKEIGGKINVQSSKGVGTAVRVKIPFTSGQPSRSSSDAIVDPTTRERLKTCTFALLGFGNDDPGEERAAKASAVLRDSITEACRGHGLLPAAESTQVDVFIIPEHKAVALAEAGAHGDVERAASRRPAIVLCHSGDSLRALTNTTASSIANAVLVSQPLGPRKLLKALAACISRTEHAQPADERPTDRNHDRSQSIVASPTSPESESGPSQTAPSLPLPAEVEAQTSQSSNTKPTTPMSGLATLLVDDNDLNLSLLRTYMRKNQHAFICASDGVAAVKAYQDAFERQQASTQDSLVPTLVIMDITMPVMDGLEATRQIRAFERSQRIPSAMVIALTAADSAEVRQEAFSSGIDLFLSKPVKLKELTVILDEHLRDTAGTGLQMDEEAEK